MKTSRFSFPRRVRIHGGECGAVARALHHAAQKKALMRHESLFLSQADFGNVPESTIERKEMSKTIKRLATVAVTALGLSLVTGVAAQAAVGDFSAVVATSSDVTTPAAATATQVAGASNFVQYTIETDDADSPLLISVSGGIASCVSATGTNSITNNGTAAVSVATTADGTVTCVTPTTAAGTITVSVFGYSSGVLDTTATSTLTITVVAALSGTVYSTSTVTETVNAVAGVYKYTDALSGTVTRLAKASSANTDELYSFDIDQEDAAGTSLAAASTKAITATLSGVGSLSINGTSATAGYVALAAASANGADVHVYADGRAGKSTLTITVNGVAVTTVEITFYGAVASYKLAMNNAYLPAGGAAGSATATALDANGQVVPDAAIHFSSATTTVATVGSATGTTDSCATTTCTAAEFAKLGTDTVAVTGVAKGTSVLTVGNAATAATITATATATVTGAQIADISWAYDKSSYEPGEKATVTVTVKDSDGNPVGDDTYTLWSTVPTADKNVTYIAAPAANAAIKSGIAQYSFYMPFSSGAVNFSGTLASDADLAAALRGVAPSLQASVRNLAESDLSDRADAAADAAAEAIDAANAATDAANLAAEAADAATVAAEEARDAADAATAAVEELATQVATLMAALKAQITTLANTVAKIAKKVKA